MSPPIGGDVFDQSSWEAYLSGSFLLSERLLLAAGMAYFDGDIDSSCGNDNIGLVLDNESVKGIVSDKVFGGCVYRIDVTAYTYSLDLSYALDRHSSLNFGASMQDGESDYQSYKNNRYAISYRYRY